jgi:hypothetical protein
VKPVSARAQKARVRKYLLAAIDHADYAAQQDPAYGWQDTLAFITQAEEALTAAREAIATPVT